MSLFNKQKNDVVWRNENGMIECHGDFCPKTCDKDCPIYLNTMAATMLFMGQENNAISLYESAIKMAPDFYDAWNNLASIYGKNGDYKKSL